MAGQHRHTGLCIHTKGAPARILKSHLVVIVVALAWSVTDASAETEFDYSLRVQNDIRFDVDRIWRIEPNPNGAGSIIDEADQPEFSRNEAAVRLKMQAAPLPRIRFVGDVELVWLNLSERVLELAELTRREDMDPWRLEAHAAYVDLYDLA